jgi:histone H3/H4
MPVSNLAAKRMLKEAGAKRVSDDALTEFAETVNRYAYKIAAKAIRLASHAKRKTVNKEDIELAK